MRDSVSFFCVIPLCALVAMPAAAQTDLFSIGASVRQLWDSNYERTPEENSEHITMSSAFVSLDKTLSRQRFIARWQLSHYDHAERPDLDATLNEGRITWQGQWGNRLKSRLEWTRDSYPVDRLEFRDKDIVKRDEAHALISYGAGHRLTLGVGGRQAEQTHSNGLREGLDFEEDEGYFEAGYKTGIQSTLFMRVRYGERIYPNQQIGLPVDDPDIDPGTLEPYEDLDFEYQQAELETVWETSAKTNLTATLGYFNRDGVVNDGTGVLAILEANWAATEKTEFNGGYSYREQAVGETSDSPAGTHTVFVGTQWQWTPKISVGADVNVIRQNYQDDSPGPDRDETVYSVAPLQMIYQFSEQFSIRLDTRWIDRDSPLAYRTYTSSQAILGLSFRY